MKSIELTVTRIGNSRGVRLPADVLRRYRVGDRLLMEQHPDVIVLRPKRTRKQKLTWAETYQQMAQSREDWSDWEAAPEGLAGLPGEAQMNRYDIHFARLDPVQGSEIGKTRPVVIVSDDLRNQFLQTVVVCPLTGQLHPDWRSRLPVRCAGKPAEIAVDQIRVLSKRRLARKIDRLRANDAEALRRLISEMYAEE